MCGACDADSSNDCVQDCAGEWGGLATEGSYYYDGDGDGLGSGDVYTFCDALLGEGWVDNDDDLDDFCFTNIHDCAGVCDGVALVDDCGVCDGGNADKDCAGVCFGESLNELFEYHSGNNLVSFYSLPDDASLNSIFEGLDFNGILGEGNASAYIGDSWYGSLEEIERDKGYWVQSNTDQDVGFCGSVSESVTYTLHDANNLISYPFIASQGLGDALPDAVEDEVFAIVGEGVASINLGGAWAGSLNGFDGGSGYWFARVAGSEDVSFEYNAPSAGNARSVTKVLPEVPEAFRYTQSTEQAFYFVESITQDGEAMTGDNWILAYNNGVVVGARMWNGEYTDIPAMGSDSSTETAGYMELGGTPSFKLFNSVTGSITDLYVDGSVDGWANNGVAVITLTDIAPIPSTVTLNNSYPNPFNPSTTISFSVPTDMNVDLKVYDISGRVVSELMGGMQSQGLYEITWDAGNNASGLYFVRLVAGSEMHTQKIMLVK